jgi:hypothetical protein
MNKWKEITRISISPKSKEEKQKEIGKVIYRDIKEKEGKSPRRRRLRKFTQKPISETEKEEFTREEFTESLEAEQHKTELMGRTIDPTRDYYTSQDRTHWMSGGEVRVNIIAPYQQQIGDIKHDVATQPKDVRIIKTDEGYVYEYSEKEQDYEPSVEGFLSFLFVGKLQYAHASLTGDVWKPGKPIENPQMKQVRLRSEQTWKESPIHMKAFYIATSPIVLPFTMKTVGLVAKGIGIGVGMGIKKVATIAPKLVNRFQKVFSSGMYTESGKFVGSRIVTRLNTSISRVGRTKFWQTVHGWGKGELVRTRAVPMIDKYTRTWESGPGRIQSTMRIYGRTGKVQWIPRKLAERTMRTEVLHRHEYTVLGYREQVYLTESLYKPKGFFGRFKKQVTLFEESEQLVKFIEKPGTYEGFVKFPTGKNITALITKKQLPLQDFWKDTSAHASLTGRTITRTQMGILGGKIHHAGYIGEVGYIPTSMYLPSVKVGSAIKLAEKGAFGLSFLNESKSKQVQRQIQIQQPILDMDLNIINIIDTKQNQLMKQQQQQKLIQRNKLVSKLVTKQRSILAPKLTTPTPNITINPPKVVPPVIPKSEKGDKIKLGKLNIDDEWGKGWRKRIWIDPIEDVI